jgi:hypothetical protein
MDVFNQTLIIILLYIISAMCLSNSIIIEINKKKNFDWSFDNMQNLLYKTRYNISILLVWYIKLKKFYFFNELVYLQKILRNKILDFDEE